uniref:zinc finger protein with KRAB and SCAN domains 2-like isoform X2 n=1 Tax=Myxine glutinosa TaxID=7769 RepID=UPI00358F3A39
MAHTNAHLAFSDLVKKENGDEKDSLDLLPCSNIQPKWVEIRVKAKALKDGARLTWWTDSETRTLISLIEDQGMVELCTGKRLQNSDVYQRLSSLLAERGFHRPSEQVRARWKKLKFWYNRDRSTTRTTGRVSPTFRFFAQLDHLLGQNSRVTCFKAKFDQASVGETICSTEESQDAGARKARGKPTWWTDEETRTLISLIKSQGMVELCTGKRLRNSDVYQRLSRLLAEKGFLRPSKQVRARWKKLKFWYNRDRCITRSTGPVSPTFRFFRQLDQLLGPCLQNWCTEATDSTPCPQERSQNTEKAKWTTPCVKVRPHERLVAHVLQNTSSDFTKKEQQPDESVTTREYDGTPKEKAQHSEKIKSLHLSRQANVGGAAENASKPLLGPAEVISVLRLHTQEMQAASHPGAQGALQARRPDLECLLLEEHRAMLALWQHNVLLLQQHHRENQEMLKQLLKQQETMLNMLQQCLLHPPAEKASRSSSPCSHNNHPYFPQTYAAHPLPLNTNNRLPFPVETRLPPL